MKRAFGLPLLVLSMSAAGAMAGWGLARYRLEQIEVRARDEPAAAIFPQVGAAPQAVQPSARPVAAIRAPAAGRVPVRTPSPLDRSAAIPSPPAVPPAAPQMPVPAAAVAAVPQTNEQVATIDVAEQPSPAPLTSTAALKAGVLIVVSIPSQRLFVFKDGDLWDSSRVSTGKPGKSTPTGTFTILEKKRRHRSTLYDDAPMPYMQRLTWGGVAMHGGRVPGYRASHGCIRLPHEFAKKLYRLTDYDSTVVVVTKKRAKSAEQALEAA